MATLESKEHTTSVGRVPESIQPGGGSCFQIELAWGRLRRWWLRTFRPGYVQAMRAVRQGTCRDCRHDIIDPRDLKLWRNVCGFWFRPEDDHFAWRGKLGLARPGLAEIICFSLLFAGITAAALAAAVWIHPAFVAALAIILPLWVFVFSFFRDPERVIPPGDDVLVSPADGKVTHIEEVAEPDFPGGRALRISIFLSVFNVHINRAPRRVRIEKVIYFPGEFLDARSGDCAKRNEQLWIDMQDQATGAPIRVKQISGAIARRIVCWLKPEDVVAAGERFGMIKFGSRTDVLIPAGLKCDVSVRVGEMVQGGSTVLLRIKT